MAKNVRGRFVSRTSAWRRTAIAIWDTPRDPTIYGLLDIDVTAAQEYVRRLSDSSGERVTLTALVTKAIAHTLAENPECNAYVRHGRLFRRDDVDVFVLVAVERTSGSDRLDADLSGVKIERADRKSVLEIARQIADGAGHVRRGHEPTLGTAKRLVKALPPSLVNVGMRLIATLQYDFNLDLSPLGIPRDTFGSAMVTSVGMLGIGRAMAPLVTVARFSAELVIGQVEDRAVVRDGQVVVRPILPLTGTFDHRVIDGVHGARFSRTLQRILLDPNSAFGSV